MTSTLVCKNISKQFGKSVAVSDVSIQMNKGEIISILGPSGCGKTTLLRMIAGLENPDNGTISIEGREVYNKAINIPSEKRNLGMVFQEYALFPHLTVRENLEFGVDQKPKTEKERKVYKIAELTQLINFMDRYPHEFSGGQRQRIAIARALALNPDFIVCDEPISALDVSIQAQIINLLEQLQDELGLTYVFIAHDMSMVRHISSRVAVMYLGKIVELTDRDQLYKNPSHPYTKALLSAVPIHDPIVEEKRSRIILEGDVPSPANPPKGCNFNTRCPVAEKQCFEEEPIFREVSPGSWCACHLVS